MAYPVIQSGYHTFVNVSDNEHGIIIPQRIYHEGTGPHHPTAAVIFNPPLRLTDAASEKFRGTAAFDVRPVTSAPDRARFTLRILVSV